ncbi:MAG: flagellar basal body P-ring formation chaperone FlgA [Candidatus Velthaea sp.]
MRRAAVLLAILTAGIIGTGASARGAVPASQVVPGTRIASIADRIARAAITGGDRAVAPAFGIVDQNVPLGEVALHAGAAQVNATYVSVPVTIAVDGKPARTVFAGYRVTSFVVTAVAAHDLGAGALLADSDVVLTRMPANGRPAVIAAALVGRKLRSATARGGVLYPEQTIVNELVKAGSPVVFVLHDGPVALSADVVARTGGGLGDQVAVYNPQTHTALSGVVTGPNTVELTLPGSNQ